MQNLEPVTAPIEDCAAEEIFMHHDILKDMNISYYAYMDSNLAMI